MAAKTSDPFGFKSAISQYERWSHAALVLSLTAILDGQLERCLKRAMRPMPNKLYADIFDPMRPLGSFASKVVMAYALGVVTRDTYLELEKVRAIRNAFAHSTALLHLDSDSIAPLFTKLRRPAEAEGKDLNLVFLECIKPLEEALEKYLVEHPESA